MGLPPKRDVQHHIDLIPDSIVPSKPAYKMNPKETMEIQWQVEELVSLGLIRESLSSCVVLALLVPKKDGVKIPLKFRNRSGSSCPSNSGMSTLKSSPLPSLLL